MNGLTYYTLTSAKSPIAMDYVFTDGYMLMAPNHGLLATSIQNRTLGDHADRARRRFARSCRRTGR